MSIKEEFPPAGSNYMDGESDGWEYRVVFSGSNLQVSYDMIRAFLEEEGYGDVPIPTDTAELELFRLPTRNHQILLFEDNGYVHNPIKILFPINRRQKRQLTLCIYNDQVNNHLIRFHKVVERNQAKLVLPVAKVKKKIRRIPTEEPMPFPDFL